MSTRKQFLGYLAVMFSAALFAVVALLTKVGYALGMTPGQILTLQTTISFLTLLLLVSINSKQGAWRVGRRQLAGLLVQGLVGSLAASYLFSSSLLYIPAALGAMLLFTYPVLVTLSSFVLFHAKVSAKEWLALLLAVAGTGLSTRFWQAAGNSLQLRGILLGLGSAVAYTFFILYGERLANQVELMISLLYIQGFSSIFLISFRLMLHHGPLFATSWQQFLIGLIMATAASILPLWLLLVGIKNIGAAKASIISTLELPITFLLAFLLLHEQFGWYETCGALLVIIAVLVLRSQDSAAVN